MANINALSNVYAQVMYWRVWELKLSGVALKMESCIASEMSASLSSLNDAVLMKQSGFKQLVVCCEIKMRRILDFTFR